MIKIFILLSLVAHQVLGKYELIPDRVEALLGDDDRFIKSHGIRIKKINRTSYALDGKFEFLYSVSDANSADVSVKNMQGGQYKEIFAKHVDAVCEGLYTEMMKDHMEALFSNLVKPIKWKTCPIPAGPNEFMNFFVEDNFLPPYIPGGEKWLFEVRINEGDECIGGYRIYTIIRNEKTLLQG